MLLFTSFLSYSSVDNSLTSDDMEYIPLYLSGISPLPISRNYSDELDFIKSVQQLVLNIAFNNDGVPLGQKREPKQLFHRKSGLCYDRSRVIEKILRYSSFSTRHISMYEKEKHNSSILTLLTSGVSSHAVSEVLTSKGWLIVDSNSAWLSLDINDQPLSVRKICRMNESSENMILKSEPPSDIYLKPFTFVYGLYSRHGLFYPPFNFIPDVNYQELLHNIQL